MEFIGCLDILPLYYEYNQNKPTNKKLLLVKQ